MSEIETKRLLLRPFRESDAADVLEYLSGPLPHCFTGLKIDSLEEARAEVVKRGEDPEYCFAIVLKETGRVIGEIDAEPSDYLPPMLRSRETPPAFQDTFTPSLILNASHQGSGYAYEATCALFDYLSFHAERRAPYLFLCGRLQCVQPASLRKARHAPRGTFPVVRLVRRRRRWKSGLREHHPVCNPEARMDGVARGRQISGRGRRTAKRFGPSGR